MEKAVSLNFEFWIFTMRNQDDIQKLDEAVKESTKLRNEGAQEWAEEGCLSLPNIHGRVRRPTYVRIRAQDLTGATFEVESETFHARIWQHEYDHLQGVLILDRMRPIDRLAARRAIKDLVGR